MDEIMNQRWEHLVEYGYFTFKELDLITSINGYNLDTLNDAIYARYGLRTYENLIDDEYEKEEK